MTTATIDMHYGIYIKKGGVRNKFLYGLQGYIVHEWKFKSMQTRKL